MTEATSDLIQLPLTKVHESLGGKMVPFAGFLMPVRYTSDIEEHLAVRNGVGVFDVSHMGEFLVEGAGALALIQQITTNDASKLVAGKVQYTCLTNREGGIVDDLLVYKFSGEKYMLVVNAGNIQKDWDWINSFKPADVVLTDISADRALFAIQGPNAVKVVEKLTGENVEAMPYYTFITTTVAGIENVLVSATGYTGAGGFELYVHAKDAVKLWEKLFEAGAAFDIKPIGLGARDTLRLEMGYCLYGNDIDDSTTPLEAGLGWITRFSKFFTGKELLEKQKETGIKKYLVGFELLERGIPRAHYEIVNADGTKIGEVTSGTQSPSLHKGIGMGYVQTAYAQPGSEVFISIRNKAHKAKIVKLPFIKQ